MQPEHPIFHMYHRSNLRELIGCRVARLTRILRGSLRARPGQLSPLSRLACAFLAMLVLLSCNWATSLVKDAAGVSNPPPGLVTPASAPALPAPPPAMTVTSQDPDEAARELAQSLAGPDKIAAWLGLYEALGIPVIGEDRLALNGSEDPVGPAYWQVWYAASLDKPGHGIRLSDAGRLLGFVFGFSPEDTQDLGEVLLSDMRSAAQSRDAPVRLLGAVARERILRTGAKLDILDDATNAQEASIDIPLLQLLFWVVIRSALMQVSAQSAVPAGSVVLAAYPLYRSRLQSSSFNCSEAWGDADSTYWANWIINKLFGGVQLPGMQKAVAGVLERTMEYMGMSEGKIASVSKSLAWANAFSSALSLLMQLASLDLVGIQEPDKLERTKTKQDGKTATIKWRLMSNPDKLPNGNEIQQCFISYIANILGVGFTFPGEGRIVGAELSFKDGMNIPDRVLFGDYNQIRSWTDGNGEVFLKMIGKGQKEELPDSVKAVDMEYSILVSAQPEESGLNTMVNIFFGGLTFGTVPGPAGFISSLIDILKTFTFDMGEHVFPMIDWESKVYRASGSSEGSISGIICDLEKPFTLYELAADNGVTYELIFTPTSAESGNMAYSGSAESCTESGDGPYTVQLNDDGSQGTITYSVNGNIECPDISSDFSGSDTFDITQDPSASCP